MKHEILYKIEAATISNFRSVIADAPFAIHFTGHGIKNDKNALGPAYLQYKDKGDILLLEDENGMADYLFEEDLKKLVQISKANKQYSHHYEVVFVSSWYSEFAGKVFLSSGARHVIWIKQNERISDKASLRFSKVFYETLFVKKYSVCKAFEIAKEDIRTLINNGEANKFILMVNNNEMTNKSQKHVWFPIATFKEGKLTKHGNDPIFNSIPTIPDNFRGRQQEIWEVISLISKSRLVNILGPPGIGKTSISRFIWNHLKDRKKYSDGILYLSLRGWESAQMFLTRLSIWILSNYEENKLNCIYQNDEISSPIKVLQNYNNKLKYEEVVDLHNNNQDFIKLIIQVLRNKELLLVLDNCEDPLEDDWDLFVHQLDMLLDEWSSIKIMLTSRKYINKLEHNTETPYHLYSLTPQASLKLLLDKTPREISNKEIEELLKYEIPSNHPIYQQFPSMNSSEITLTNHPFILMLGGHPQAISLAAPMLEHQTLTELFQQLIDSNIMDALSFKGKQSYTSLRISLEISINNIQKHNPQALDLFKFIGLLPGGIRQTELTDLWGDASWKSLKDDLIRASLLVYKPTENILTLLPFMNTRAYELLETEEFKKNEFHTKIWRFYKNFLKSYEQKMNENSSDLNEFVEKEANIWAWIYRSINRKKDNIEFDEEESNYLQFNNWSGIHPLSFGDDFQRHSTSSNLLKPQSSFFEGINDIEEIKEEKEDDKDNSKDEINDQYSDNDSIDLNLDNNTPINQIFSGQAIKKKSESIWIVKEVRSLSTKMKRLSTENFKIASLNSLRKSVNSIESENGRFKDEEILVIYYISIVIRLLKFSDGLKAISEYEKKEGLTKRAQAHIFKLKGVIGLLTDKSDESQVD